MTKKMIWDSVSVDFEGRLLYLTDYVQGLREKYGDEAYIEIEYDYENTDYVLKFQREENDKEYQRRLKAEAKQKEIDKKALEKKKEKERKEYERLKKLFGDEE